MTMLPDEDTVPEDDGLIEFVAPDPAQPLEIRKDEDMPPRTPVVISEPLLPAFVLGETDIRVELDSLAKLQEAAVALLAQARREVLLITPDLEPERFNDPAFLEALSAFARSSRYAVTRILVADPQPAVKDGHRLIPLARKLSSLISIRQIHEDDIDLIQPWLVADDIGLLRCTNRDPWQGSLLPKGTPYAQQVRERFMEWWERASDVPDFRELSL